MARPLFPVVMMTSWLYMLGQCSSSGVGVKCSPDIISQTVRVNCAVNYSKISKSSVCVTEWGFLQTQNCSTDKGLECSYGKEQNCTIGPGKNTLSAEVINLQKQQEYRVSIHTNCGDAETSFHITPSLQVSGDPRDPDSIYSPADQKVTWAILGTCIGVILMIAAVIFLQRKKLPHPISADDYDTDVDSNRGWEMRGRPLASDTD